MRLIDADFLEEVIDGTTMSQEQRNLFHALVAHCPKRGYEEFEVKPMLNEIDYWRNKCSEYETTIVKLAVRFVECTDKRRRDEDETD